MELEMKTELPNTSFKLILYLLTKQQWSLVFLCVVCILTGCIPSVDSILFKQLINTVESIENTEDTLGLLLPWAIYYALWWEVINIHWRAYDYFYLSSIPQLKASVIDNFYNYIQYHSNEFFQERMVGYISNRVTEAARSLEMIVYLVISKIMMQIASIVAALVTMYCVHMELATILLIWVSVFCAISIFCSKKATKYSGLVAKNKATITGKIVDVISNISAVRMFSSYRYEQYFLETQLDITVASEKKFGWYMLKLRYALGLSCTILIFFMVYQLASLKSRGLITIGDFVLVMTLCLIIADSIWDMTEEIGNLFEEFGIFNQSISLIQPYLIKDKENASILKINNGTIQFKKVSFKYNKDGDLFTDKNLIIPGGQKVGLVGFSGSGKSTFVSLISRLYDVTSGAILIDNQNIKDVMLESLRDNISLIPQEPILFHRTIKENIRYGIQASDEEVIEAAKKAHIHNDIMKLPSQYNTMCGERGNNLSGGQRQRVIIARAILKNSTILILDEATSSLDNITEQHIQDSLSYLMKNRTVLVIAHRLSTLLDMDRILVFDKGKIVEDGTHKDLLKMKGLYCKLWNLQNKGFLLDG
jgi:ATP-binding cassette subfamily B protein